ncbi:hypothetical protein P8A18_00095 [Streptomyces castrisilvae]|uniref:Uncharacterized protein n=1 Tax=Streptomyces castrisilvae TaxID=3033811 RepID=A0ABY9HCA5_9ACTN|nr:hypothetical protein [Streptomyces sp. Mut1]WLQ31931.1 hypothetical protein P8A18_00095 [Streptomyces sp. Mut1]
MTNGLTWIGAHAHTATPVPGMRGGISLTLARGIDADELLINLGADLDQLAARTPLAELRSQPTPPGHDPTRYAYAMYGSEGEWTYVLENDHAATWATGFRRVPSMRPGPGEEILCASRNLYSPPAAILHVEGDEVIRRAEFGTTTGHESALDAALTAAGAVFPSIPDATADEVTAYYEQHGTRLPTLVFTALGAYTGLSIDQDAAQAGNLPAVHLLTP